MRIAVTGSTGLVGRALVADLRASGHTVSRLVRGNRAEPATERLIAWNPDRGVIDAQALEAHDAVVHLAGEPIFGVWTSRKKAAIRDSRVRGTTLLARTLASLKQPPAVLVSASASGYYGNRPGELLDESAERGRGFLADVVAQWEECTQPARAAGIRVVNMRSGIILSPRGGALPIMLRVFKAGLGGRLGSGKQYWSWITLRDVVGAINHAIAHRQLDGPANFSSPGPVTNEQFTETLGQVLRRPTVLPAPAFAMRLVLQEMADEMLLTSFRMVPRKLEETNFAFRDPELGGAFRAILVV